jgi:NifU-like protein involved in Fe-S cluster formation
MSDEATRVRALYNDRIMSLADDIPLSERLADPDATVSVRSPLCGSRITIDLAMDGDKVAAYGQTVRACTLGRAAASIMARHVVGRSGSELRRVARAMRAMLKQGEKLPEDVWPELQVLAPAADFRSRHGSVLLSFDAVEKALDEIEARST